jgi:hypothetical protein
MALSTYSELQTSVAAWLSRSDLTALIPDFIRLAEERLNRALRVRQMEVALAETAVADGVIAVPADTCGVKALWIVGHETAPLASATFDFIKTRGSEGVPANYAWQGDSFHFDGAGSVAGVLYTKIPALSDAATTNWLLTAHPSAYLFGTLAEAFSYARNQAERDRWDGRFQQAVNDIGGADMRDRFSGPLTVRVR